MIKKEKVCKHYSNGKCLEDTEIKECRECVDCYFKIAQRNTLAFKNLLKLYKNYIKTSASQREEELAQELSEANRELDKLKENIKTLRRRNIKLAQDLKRKKTK